MFDISILKQFLLFKIKTKRKLDVLKKYYFSFFYKILSNNFKKLFFQNYFIKHSSKEAKRARIERVKENLVRIEMVERTKPSSSMIHTNCHVTRHVVCVPF